MRFQWVTRTGVPPLRRIPTQYAILPKSAVGRASIQSSIQISTSMTAQSQVHGNVRLTSRISKRYQSTVSQSPIVKELNKKTMDEQESNLDDQLAQEKEKQTRTPWHREGAEKPPVARQRSAGAMTKGTLETPNLYCSV